jgi:hypothetical protein
VKAQDPLGHIPLRRIYFQAITHVNPTDDQDFSVKFNLTFGF